MLVIKHDENNMGTYRIAGDTFLRKQISGVHNAGSGRNLRCGRRFRTPERRVHDAGFGLKPCAHGASLMGDVTNLSQTLEELQLSVMVSNGVWFQRVPQLWFPTGGRRQTHHPQGFDHGCSPSPRGPPKCVATILQCTIVVEILSMMLLPCPPPLGPIGHPRDPRRVQLGGFNYAPNNPPPPSGENFLPSE